MLVRFFPHQVAEHWELLGEGIRAGLPPIAGESDEKMNNVLKNILLRVPLPTQIHTFVWNLLSVAQICVWMLSGVSDERLKKPGIRIPNKGN